VIGIKAGTVLRYLKAFAELVLPPYSLYFSVRPNKMKIAFIDDGVYAYASNSPEAVGGSERDQWLLANALVAANWSAVVGVRRGLKVGERKTIKGVEYVGIGPDRPLLAWHSFLASEKPDWLFWECAYHLWGALVEIAKINRVKTIFHAAFDTDVEPRKALSWRRNWWPLYAWGLSRSDRIFVQHSGQLANLRRPWQCKAYVLPKVCILPGVVGDQLIVKPHREREKYVAWVATLRQHKRPDVLMEIARKMPSFRFVVCGGPTTFMTSTSFRDRILDELSAAPNIEYLGQVAPETAQEVIANAALLLSTSDSEGFPNTFVQAWSSGTPVVSLKIDPDGGIERLGLGRISGDVDRAIEDITGLIESTDRRDEIAQRTRRFVVENYSASAVVRLFQRALDGGH
jgi:glycosyltransferase involved in cell wall biosynthesis